MKRWILSLTLLAGLAFATHSAQAKDMTATFETNKGTFVVKLFPDIAPKTVENFVGLARGEKEFKDPETGEMVKRRYYDGLTFHRVIEDFMIQGGDPLGNGRGGPGYKFEDEFEKHPGFSKPGYLAMANAGPNTNGSQFFITVVPTPWLNPKNGRGHTLFGEVIKGFDVVEKISRVEVRGSVPVHPVVIKKLTIQ